MLGPHLVEQFTEWLSDQHEQGGILGTIADGDPDRRAGRLRAVSIATQTPGWPLNVFDWNVVIYGVLIIVFLIFEPLGLYGIWVKVRNYWKRWPFSY